MIDGVDESQADVRVVVGHEHDVKQLLALGVNVPESCVHSLQSLETRPKADLSYFRRQCCGMVARVCVWGQVGVKNKAYYACTAHKRHDLTHISDSPARLHARLSYGNSWRRPFSWTAALVLFIQALEGNPCIDRSRLCYGRFKRVSLALSFQRHIFFHVNLPLQMECFSEPVGSSSRIHLAKTESVCFNKSSVCHIQSGPVGFLLPG